ncbi:MAG: large subunit ribosomal protein [Bacteroidota bacterium]|nr:large subunit ribosomal protein [Bacteroidota bacterium]
MKLKIKKGDFVKVIAGNYRDTEKLHRVLEVYPKKMRVLVEGVSLRTKHTKPSQENPKGGKIKKEMPINYSNVMIVDSDKNATRIGIRYEEKDGKSIPIRFARSNGNDL